jgi:hypothetical protein
MNKPIGRRWRVSELLERMHSDKRHLPLYVFQGVKELEGYKEHHEFVCQQLERLVGKEITTLGVIVDEYKKLQAEIEKLQSIASENQKISDGWREAHGKAMDKLEAEEEKNKYLKVKIDKYRSALEQLNPLDVLTIYQAINVLLEEKDGSSNRI